MLTLQGEGGVLLPAHFYIVTNLRNYPAVPIPGTDVVVLQTQEQRSRKALASRRSYLNP